MGTTAISLDGFPLIGATPGGGTALVRTFDGWLANSTRRGRDVSTSHHGGYSSVGLLNASELTVSGLIRYSTAADCAAERRQLPTVGGFGQVPLLVTDALGEFGMTVVVDERAIKPMNDRLLSFSFDLVADDPLVRSTTANTPVTINAGATQTVPNGGTVAADMRIALLTTGTVKLTMDFVTLETFSLAAGTVIDTGAGTVIGPLDDDFFDQLKVPIQWLKAAPGGTPAHQEGTANLDVTTFDTYA